MSRTCPVCSKESVVPKFLIFSKFKCTSCNKRLRLEIPLLVLITYYLAIGFIAGVGAFYFESIRKEPILYLVLIFAFLGTYIFSIQVSRIVKAENE